MIKFCEERTLDSITILDSEVCIKLDGLILLHLRTVSGSCAIVVPKGGFCVEITSNNPKGWLIQRLPAKASKIS